MVVRNEEKRLPPLLAQLRPHFSEIVIVDQESTDRTIELSRPYADKIISVECTGNSSSSRGISFDACSNDWIFTLDADEFITDRFLGDMQDWVKYDVDGIYFHIEHVINKTADEVNGITYEQIRGCIPLTQPNIMRLGKKSHLTFDPKLHGGIGLKHLSRILLVEYIGVLHTKDMEEWWIDHSRYTAIKEGRFNKDSYQ